MLSLTQRRSIVMPTFHPEYGRYMLESTPGAPYGPSLPDLLSVEANMRYRCAARLLVFRRCTHVIRDDRRRLAKAKLKDHELPITFTSFPRLGAGDFLDPPHEPDGPASRSLFLPDQLINPHIRFPCVSSALVEAARPDTASQDIDRQHPTPKRVESRNERSHLPRPPHSQTIPRPDDPQTLPLPLRRRSLRRRRQARPHLHGRHGLRHGLLLLADHFSSLLDRRGEEGV